MRDPYSVLGVGKTASDDDIKKAFRKQAKILHPDRNKTDPKAKDKFAELNSAYEILGDNKKRKQFDSGEIDAEGKPRAPFGAGFGGGARGGRTPETPGVLAVDPRGSRRRRPGSPLAATSASRAPELTRRATRATFRASEGRPCRG